MPTARIHALLISSRANGPGLRNVVWFQGCSLGCPGCFNPETHPFAGGERLAIADLVERLLTGDPDGVTLSGGEPFQQPEALLGLVRGLRTRRPALSLLAFSGYSIVKIRRLSTGQAILHHLDVLVAGPYVRELHLGRGLLGSVNQQIHLLSHRHRPEEIATLPLMEVILHQDGTLTCTGIRSPLLSAVALSDSRWPPPTFHNRHNPRDIP